MNDSLQRGEFWIESVREIGVGGLGRVDEVVVTASHGSHPVGTRLARKRLNATWALNPGAQVRFEREIEMLGQMNHPNIVGLSGVSLAGQPRFYVMPVYPRSLRTAMIGGSYFSTVQEIARFGAKLADALRYAHALNFIHRDLKPENILLDGADDPVLADWGLGQFIHQHSKVLDLTRGGPMGTFHYCSAEQWAQGRCEVTGDVYSLGVILAELGARKATPMPFPGAGITNDPVLGDTPAITKFNFLIRKMTMLMANQRPQTMTQVLAELSAI